MQVLHNACGLLLTRGGVFLLSSVQLRFGAGVQEEGLRDMHPVSLAKRAGSGSPTSQAALTCGVIVLMIIMGAAERRVAISVHEYGSSSRSPHSSSRRKQHKRQQRRPRRQRHEHHSTAAAVEGAYRFKKFKNRLFSKNYNIVLGNTADHSSAEACFVLELVLFRGPLAG